ncbi:MAG: hypothetical protein ACI4J5_06475 [Oscillospiraceae bacterium]
METGFYIFIAVMLIAAAAEVILSFYYRPERVIFFPVTKDIRIDSSAAEELFGASGKTKICFLNMGADPALWNTLAEMAENSENVFCLDEADILTYL